MFKRNDKFLFMAITVADVYAILIATAFAVLGIVDIVNGAELASTETIILGVFFIPIGLVFAFVFWVFVRVLLSLVCDVKLIRNKMYGEDNSAFAKITAFEKASKETFDDSDTQTVSVDTEIFNKKTVALLRELKQLCAEGIISEEEFKQEKSKLLKKGE